METSSNRLCAINVEFNNISLLLFNVYMPCDTEYDHGNADLFRDVLTEVSTLSLKLNTDHVICAGDFNTDMSRHNSLHTQILCKFTDEESLVIPSLQDDFEIDYSFESKATGARSIVDHILMTPNLFDFMQTYDVRHDGDNMSDHSVIYTVLNLDMKNTTCTGDTGSADTADPPLNRPNWKHVSAEQHARYTDMLNELLNDIQVPTEAIKCRNSKCDSHTYDIELFHDQIINACLTASRHTLC